MSSSVHQGEKEEGVISSDTSRPEEWLSFALAFVGGYGDAVSVVLAKTFTGHVTGSLVLAAIAIAAHGWHALVVHLSAVLFFLVGVISSVLMERILVAWPFLKHLPAILSIEVVLTVTGYLALASRVGPRIEIFVVCLSLALGMQNGAFQRTGGISVHTTYLTGMITSLMTAEAKQSQIMSTRDPKLNLLYGIWLAFFVGAAVGAAMAFRVKETAILGATFLLLIILLYRIRERGSLST
ncbi:MAG: hypothetical protein QOJ51_7194 [Acidobacteriaceae bacterium]|jgi:uncharacterized membrane protein YoaK (UPF0700 family)|nr:hypothetical protein [Acidobacteriaceae bacterium]MEA2264369.1 hypothetical protein [Acidobacteriaceae bacterium]